MTLVTLEETIIGIHALDQKNNIITQHYFINDPGKIAKILVNQREGKLTSQMKAVIEKLKEKKVKKILSSNTKLLKTLSSEFGFETEYIEDNEPARFFRENIAVFAFNEGFIEDVSEFGDYSHRILESIAKEFVRRNIAKRENLLIPSTMLLDDLNTIINSLTSRLREWYGIHFPEMGNWIKDHLDYSKVITKFDDKSDITTEELKELNLKEIDAEKIEQIALDSVGADLDELDILAIKNLAFQILELYQYREKLQNYVSSLLFDIAPNLHKLAGPLLGAKLIEKAGGLSRIALLPASTIQILGAEKAMFRSIKTKAKPPKHGLIFQHPYVYSAPRKMRGSRARSLASKLAIAARADYFTGAFIADKLIIKLKGNLNKI